MLVSTQSICSTRLIAIHTLPMAYATEHFSSDIFAASTMGISSLKSIFRISYHFRDAYRSQNSAAIQLGTKLLDEITMRIHHHKKNQDLCETSPFSQLVNIVGTPIKDGK